MAVKFTKDNGGSVSLQAPYLNVDTGKFYDAGYTDGERAGYAKGYGEGYTEGEKVSYDVGYNKGFEDGGRESFELGKKAQYDEFWDTYQRNGKRKNYSNAFKYWRPQNFYPKYDIRPTESMSEIFSNFGAQEIIEQFDLEARLQECGVVLDCSKTTNLNSLFWSSSITRVGTIDTRNVSSMSTVFSSCSYLKTIEKVILKNDGSQTFSSTFSYCALLENLTIEGLIGKNGFDMKNSPRLTHESLMSIINALQDKTGTSGTTWTITLGSTNIAKLTQEELDIIETKGWQVK